jgi:catechol 2,3-dioxygenase-like lactoylglutathione lyase family enzyme
VDPLLRKVDCVQIPVPDLDEGLRFYRDGLGLALKWRHATQAGLRLGDTELVLQTERPDQETDFLPRLGRGGGPPGRGGGRDRAFRAGGHPGG